MVEQCNIYCSCCGAFRSATLTDGDGFILPSATEPAFVCDECDTAWRVEFHEAEADEPREPDCLDLAKAHMEAHGER